jgi:hypothetical protein
MVFRKIKLALGLILLTLISTSGITQTASAVFESEDAFQLTINNIKQHKTYSKNSIVYKLSGDRPYQVKIEFEEDTFFVQQNIYTIDEGLTHVYNISKKSLQLKKVIPSASYIKPKNILEVTYKENAEFFMDTLKADTLQAKDSAYVVPFANYYQLKDYEGRIGCPYPISDEQQSKLNALIIAEKLEESKLEIVKEALLDIDSVCLLMDHITALTSLFEYEETRINFINDIAPFTFDIDNYERLYPLFNFDNNKDEIKRLFKSKD